TRETPSKTVIITNRKNGDDFVRLGAIRAVITDGLAFFYFPDGQRFCDDSYYLLRVLLRAVKINTDANIISACDRIVSDAGRAMNTFEFLLAYILGKFFFLKPGVFLIGKMRVYAFGTKSGISGNEPI